MNFLDDVDCPQNVQLNGRVDGEDGVNEATGNGRLVQQVPQKVIIHDGSLGGKVILLRRRCQCYTENRQDMENQSNGADDGMVAAHSTSRTCQLTLIEANFVAIGASTQTASKTDPIHTKWQDVLGQLAYEQGTLKEEGEEAAGRECTLLP